MLRFPPVLALAALLALAGPVASQTSADPLDSLTPGHRALAFTLPYGGSVGFGSWRVVAPDRARGIFINLSANSEQRPGYSGEGSRLRETNVSASIGPHVRRYLARSVPVVPFLESGLEIGGFYNSVEDRETFPQYGTQSGHEWGALGALSTGFGAEWFPLPRMSISGQVGFQLNGQAGKHVYEPGGSTTIWRLGLNSYGSALTLQLYF